MKEYIKLFKDLQSADGYIIADIPFTSTVKPDVSGDIPQNVRCVVENKKIEVSSGGTIEVVDDEPPVPLNTILHLQDGSEVELTSATITSAMTSAYKSTLVSVEVGSSVTGIGQYAFSGCTGLTSITIPSSVTNIGNHAFFDCTGLPVVDGIRYADTCLVDVVDESRTTYTIQSNTKWISNTSFYNCKSLISITIPNSVTSIGDYAFSGCAGLTSVTIPNSVTSIGNGAFDGCIGLTNIVIPNSVTSIGVGVFNNCTALPVVDGVRYADTYCVGAVDKTQSTYTIQSTVRWIGGSAFNNCSGLTLIVIPDSVTSIGSSAFRVCTSLSAITIGSGVTSIGDYAFSGCTGLTIITIPSGVTTIGSNAFYNVPVIIYNGSATGSPWGAKARYGAVENGLAYSDTGKTQLVMCIDKTLTSVTIPNSVTSIGEYAFSNCTNLTSVTIPDSVTSIGDWAFDSCTRLTSVTIPNSVTSIGNYAFSSCSSLTSATIGNRVTSIGDGAFFTCTSLTSVTIPNSVTSIGYTAFYDTTEINYSGTSTQWHNTFDNVWDYDSFPFSGSVYIHCLGDNVDVYVEQPERPFCCFVAGTQIQQSNNVTKNIEDVQIGDEIISYNPLTDELYTTTVAHTIIHENTTTLARVTLANGLTVEMNEYHPILTRNGWHSITNYEGYDTLVVGDEVKTLDGYSEIVGIERWINKPILTYNLDVVDVFGRDREYDNYFANGICVHNPIIC